MMAFASTASAGPNGGWGKGLLSVYVPFNSDNSDYTGYMNYCPDSTEFIFDFHAFGVPDGMEYTLICYQDLPEDPFPLGTPRTGQYVCTDGIHIKDTLLSWPGMNSATVLLVSGDLDPDDWTVYMTATNVDLSGP